jgi:hypothetical protein
VGVGSADSVGPAEGPADGTAHSGRGVAGPVLALLAFATPRPAQPPSSSCMTTCQLPASIACVRAPCSSSRSERLSDVRAATAICQGAMQLPAQSAHPAALLRRPGLGPPGAAGRGALRCRILPLRRGPEEVMILNPDSCPLPGLCMPSPVEHPASARVDEAISRLHCRLQILTVAHLLTCAGRVLAAPPRPSSWRTSAGSPCTRTAARRDSCGMLTSYCECAVKRAVGSLIPDSASLAGEQRRLQSLHQV